MRDARGLSIGRVTEVIESPAHAILAVSLRSGAETLVPFVAAAVSSVDVEQGYLVVEPAFLEVESKDIGSRLKSFMSSLWCLRPSIGSWVGIP